jgi:hypothetical protein
MNILLTEQTQRLLEEEMKARHAADPDEVLRLGLLALRELQGEPYEQLDERTRIAIEEAEAQYARGEERPWDVVREELRARFVRK